MTKKTPTFIYTYKQSSQKVNIGNRAKDSNYLLYVHIFKHACGNSENLDVFQEVLEGPLTDHDTLWNVAKEKHIPKGLFV